MPLAPELSRLSETTAMRSSTAAMGLPSPGHRASAPSMAGPSGHDYSGEGTNQAAAVVFPPQVEETLSTMMSHPRAMELLERAQTNLAIRASLKSVQASLQAIEAAPKDSIAAHAAHEAMQGAVDTALEAAAKERARHYGQLTARSRVSAVADGGGEWPGPPENADIEA